MLSHLAPLTTGNAEELAHLLRLNRRFLAPWEPARDDGYFTEETQRESLLRTESLREQELGESWGVYYQGELAGQITLNGITRGAAQSASVGYWLSEQVNGQGVMSDALTQVIEIAFGSMRLHRIDASALPENEPSLRVLAKNGFEHVGTAPGYLKIAGKWRAHRLLQRLASS